MGYLFSFRNSTGTTIYLLFFGELKTCYEIFRLGANATLLPPSLPFPFVVVVFGLPLVSIWYKLCIKVMCNVLPHSFQNRSLYKYRCFSICIQLLLLLVVISVVLFTSMTSSDAEIVLCLAYHCLQTKYTANVARVHFWHIRWLR